MDINQNQLVNTFTKGMNTDTSDALISNEQYRYAENVRPITDTDSNSGELYLIEGTSITNILNDIEFEKILAVDSIRNYIVFILYKEGNWAIYKSIDGLKAQLVFGWSDHKIWKDELPKLKTISTVLRWESDKNIKLYIADGIDPLLSINIYYNAEDGVEDNKYNGKTFDDVFGYQTIPLSAPEVLISDVSGFITAGVVQYAYRLYAKNGAATNLSPLSKPLSLYKSNREGYASEAKTGRAVLITYPDIDSGNLDYILIYRINFIQSGLLPTISLIKDEKLKSGTTTDTGVGDIQDIAVSEFLAMIDTLMIPTVIESKNDYLFAANLNYDQDNVDNTFSSFDSRSYSNGNFVGETEGESLLSLDKVNSEDLRHHLFVDENGVFINTNGEYNSSYWNFPASSNNSSWNGVGKYIKWKYKYSEYYKIDVLNQASTIKDSHRSFRRGEVYRFGMRLFDNKGRASSVKWIADIMMPPLQVTNAGANASLPRSTTDDFVGFSGDICYYDGDAYIRDLGIQFDVDLGEFNNKCSGYEIVRCNRAITDKYTVTQGITGFPLELYLYAVPEGGSAYEEKPTNLICPSGFMSLNNFFVTTNFAMTSVAIPEYKTLMFASPEYCYLPDDIEQLLKSYSSSLFIQQVAQYKPNSIYETSSVPGTLYFDEFTTGTVRSLQNINGGMSYKLWPYIGDIPVVASMKNNGYIANFTGNSSYIVDTEVAMLNTHVSDLFSSVTLNNNGSDIDIFFNYITPNSVENHSERNSSIDNINFVKSPQYSDFATADNFTFQDSVISIKDKLFINWSAPLILDISGNNRIELKNITKADGSLWQYQWADGHVALGSRLVHAIGSGGAYVLLKLKEARLPIELLSSTSMPQIIIENLRKPAVPYGGYSYNSTLNSIYYSYGDYSPSSNSTMTTFSGDSRIKMFTYNALHNWYNSTFWKFNKMGTVYCVPIESDIDLQGQFGIQYGVDTISYYIQDKASAFSTYTQEKDSYLYNTIYNVDLDVVSYSSDVKTAAETNNFDTRIHYSEVKTNNEMIDSWLLFKAMNFLDVDSRFGEITDLKLFKDKLVFWQNNAAGLLSVNERMILNDQNDTLVVLGTGGVLERYDYFTTVYGLKPNQHARAISNDALYWWDGYNKAILLYLNKFEVTPLSTTKTVTNYINTREEVETPVLIYDPKFKEVICNVVRNNESENNESVVYNEQILAFSSVYTFSPVFSTLVNDTLYITDADNIYKYNNEEINGKAKLFDTEAKPLVKYIVNANSTTPKVFDILTFGGRFYGGNDLSKIEFIYNTPLKQRSKIKGVVDKNITNREYDYRLTIPRNTNTTIEQWGDRMRGKTMQCELKSESNDRDFSLQYIITKFRMSWT